MIPAWSSLGKAEGEEALGPQASSTTLAMGADLGS
jgi:hypothetical protein